jgi:hypothetical protein
MFPKMSSTFYKPKQAIAHNVVTDDGVAGAVPRGVRVRAPVRPVDGAAGLGKSRVVTDKHAAA